MIITDDGQFIDIGNKSINKAKVQIIGHDQDTIYLQISGRYTSVSSVKDNLIHFRYDEIEGQSFATVLEAVVWLKDLIVTGFSAPLAITSAPTFIVYENVTFIGEVTANKPGGTFDFNFGPDDSLFTIDASTGGITPVIEINFEDPKGSWDYADEEDGSPIIDGNGEPVTTQPEPGQYGNCYEIHGIYTLGSESVEFTVYICVKNVLQPKAGLIVRYGIDPALAAIMHEYGDKVTMLQSYTAVATEAQVDEMLDCDAKGKDVGVWANSYSNSVFFVNQIIQGNEQYYQDQDDLEPEENKGIEQFYTYDGKRFCIQRIVWPSDPLSLPTGHVYTYEFTTIAGGSRIQIDVSNMYSGRNTAIYLDSTKAYAADFPAAALNKWWTLFFISTGVYELRKNDLVPMHEWVGAAISASNAYTGGNGVIGIYWQEYWPHLTGLKYQFQENKRLFEALGLNAPLTTAEIENGGYPQWAVYPGNGMYNMLYDLGYRAGTRDPVGYCYVGLKYEEDGLRYRIMPSLPQAIESLASLQAAKEKLADNFARNHFTIARAQLMGGFMDEAGWRAMLDICHANDIPVMSYPEYVHLHLDADYEYGYNIFPRLNMDVASRATGTPDGFTTLPAGLTLKTIGGHSLDSGYYVEIANASSNKLTVPDLAGFRYGDHTVSFYAKNDNSATDQVVIRITDYDTGIYQDKTAYVKGSDWTQFSFDMSVDNVMNNIEVFVGTWGSSGTVDISGIEIKHKAPAEINTGGYETESTALFTRMQAAGSEPDTTRKGYIDATIKALKKNVVNETGYENLWERLPLLHMHAAHSEAAAKLEWKGIYDITPYNSPSYVVDRGWALNGINQYLGTGFTPSSIPAGSRKFEVYDSALGVYINENPGVISSGVDFGARPSTNARAMIDVNNNAAYLTMAVNTPVVVFTSPPSRTGFFAMSSYNRTQQKMLVEETEAGVSLTNQTICNSELLYGKYGSIYKNNRYASGFTSSGLTVRQMKDFRRIIKTEYLDKIGASV